MTAMGTAVNREPDLDVRVVLGLPFPGEDFERDAQWIRDLGPNVELPLESLVRLLNPRHFVHCHNTLIVVDEETVLVGSQSWSDFAVTENCKMRLLVRYPELVQHYQDNIEFD
jgi:hypothetical protein